MCHDEPGPNIACMWSEGTSPAAQSGVQRTPKVPSPEFNFVWYPMRGETRLGGPDSSAPKQGQKNQVQADGQAGMWGCHHDKVGIVLRCPINCMPHDPRLIKRLDENLQSVGY